MQRLQTEARQQLEAMLKAQRQQLQDRGEEQLQAEMTAMRQEAEEQLAAQQEQVRTKRPHQSYVCRYALP